MSVSRTAFLATVLVLGGCVGSVDGGTAPTSIGPSGTGGASSTPMGGPNRPPGAGGAGAGSGGGAGGAGSPGGMPPAFESGPGRLRRLTRAQFESSLRDLLGADVPIGEVERDTERDGFAAVGASYAAVSGRAAEQYEAAIDKALGHVFADPARWTQRIGCRPSSPDDRACLEQLVAGFGRRAWRRPLSAAEIQRYATLAGNAARTLGDVGQGVMHAVSGLLASPNFIYRVELGAPDPAAPARHRYSAWEMASRLSYLIWDTTPDEALLAAAESGALDRPDGIRAQAQRLLASPRARAGLGAFAAQVTGLGDLENTPKNDPRYTPTLRAAMQAEVLRVYERLLEPGQSALDLLDSTRTFANAELARLYGIAGPAGAELEPVELPAAGPRAGVLGTAAFLTLNSEQDGTSPHRPRRLHPREGHVPARGRATRQRRYRVARSAGRRDVDPARAPGAAPQAARLCRLPRHLRPDRLRVRAVRLDRRPA
jgi:hypothetical protein